MKSTKEEIQVIKTLLKDSSTTKYHKKSSNRSILSNGQIFEIILKELKEL